MTNDATYTARPESWSEVKRLVHTVVPFAGADCLIELRARVERLEQAQQQGQLEGPNLAGQLARTAALKLAEMERRLAALEQAQQQPAPSTPAGRGELFDRVAAAMSESPTDVILAVADWLVDNGAIIGPSLLRREAGR